MGTRCSPVARHPRAPPHTPAREGGHGESRGPRNAGVRVALQDVGTSRGPLRGRGVEPAPRADCCARLRARLHVGARPLDGRVLREQPMRSRLLTVVLFALAFPQAALARGTFDPTKEFAQHEWVPIHLGPLNLSVTKAVVYMMLGTLLTILLGITVMCVKRPGRRQALG